MSEESLAILAVLGSFLAVIIVFALIWAVLQIIARWRIFTKAGEAGWKSLIPFYNLYTQYKLTWKTSIFWAWLVLSIVSGILSPMTKAESSGISIVASILAIIVGIAIIVLNVKTYYMLAKSFGYGVGFTVGLFFLEPIFLLILGFDNSQYIGNTSENISLDIQL